MGSLATFDAMGQFIGLMTDPFIAGRGAGFGSSAGERKPAIEKALSSKARERALAHLPARACSHAIAIFSKEAAAAQVCETGT
jgi:hypothetical protein